VTENIDEIEEHYFTSRIGHVSKRSSEKLMYVQTCKLGYQRVWLTVNGKRKAYFVHRLVALKFVDGMTDERCDVNHKDGVKDNNFYKNLEWVTKSENYMHAMNVLGKKMCGKKGRSGRPKGSKNKTQKRR
tara:strand:- start:2209 stop:2598 length:390 start_codon:yes stop_codon:yes gene_type:complete